MESGLAQVWLSPALNDPCWDDFLRRTSHGQYQQSSLWAEFKAEDGWEHHRVVVTDSREIIGGYQLLWKKKGPVRIGYVSKGPVTLADFLSLRTALLSLLANSAHELDLSALISQSPDECRNEEESAAQELGFFRSNPMDVIEATYLVNVREELRTIRQRMNRNMRKCVRKAVEQGMVVRQGTEVDLPLFFDLMTATCRRQKSKPNPPDLGALQRLWRVFARHDLVEITFAGGKGKEIAGLMSIIFGDRVTLWKKGWDGSNPNWHPNELLIDHAFERAHGRGYSICDFSAISRPAAVHILSGASLDASMARSQDMFKLRMGGYPRLLPRARLYVTNPILRWGYVNTYGRFEKFREHRLLTDPVPMPSLSGPMTPNLDPARPAAGGAQVAHPSDRS